MGLPDDAPVDGINVAGGGRKAEALEFITAYLLREGRSPVMEEIGRGLGVSRSRAKTLVDLLTVEGKVVRTRGSQRGITVPGLQRDQLLAALRNLGAVVDEDFNCMGSVLPVLPQHPPLVAIIDHCPDAGDRNDHAERRQA